MDDLTDQVVVQNYYFDIPKSLLFRNTTQLQVAAGGTRYLAMMKAKNFDVVVGTALCDFAAIPDPDNGYKCAKCREGYFTPELRGQRCLSCAYISDFYGVLTSKMKARMLFVCGDLANSGI